MRLFSFLFNLITLFPIKPEVGIKNHIIMSEEKKKVDINQLSYYTKGNKIDNIITFNLENNIYLSKFLDKEDILKLKSSKSNYIKFGNSEYINYMNFDDYCKLEKK